MSKRVSNEIEVHVERVLIGMGFAVERIATGDERRADFRASAENELHIIEVRSRTDDGSFARTLLQGELAESERVDAHDSATASLIRDKNDQLRATPAPPGTSRVLWIVALGDFAGDIENEVVSTFYGRVTIAELGPRSQPSPHNTAAPSRPCYFFDRAECTRRTDIDAIVIGDGKRARLLVNPYGKSVGNLTASRLHEVFAQSDAVVSPREDEEARKAFTADDYQGDRTDERALRAFLEKKYAQTMLIPLRMKSHKVGLIAARSDNA